MLFSIAEPRDVLHVVLMIRAGLGARGDQGAVMPPLMIQPDPLMAR